MRGNHWYITGPLVIVGLVVIIAIWYFGDGQSLHNWAEKARYQPTKVSGSGWQTVRNLLPEDMQDDNLWDATDVIQAKTGVDLSKSVDQTISLPIPYAQWRGEKLERESKSLLPW